MDTPLVGYELVEEKWKAYVTAVSAKWLQQKYITYKDDIFSGNPRTYLGSGKKKNKINLGIKETIDQQPKNFWTYNNGITALVLYAISKCMEVIVGRKVHDSWAFSFKNNTDFDELANLWNSVIKAILPVACAPLEEALKDGLKNKELAEKASNTVSGLLTSVQDMLQGQLRPFVGAANV